MSDRQRWETTKYELLSVQPTDRFVAIYAIVADDGLCDLETRPIHAVGIAKVITRYYRGNFTDKVEIREPEISQDIVGLMLREGYFQIVNEDSNFGGLMGLGGNIYESLGYLKSEFSNLRDDRRF